MIELCLLHVYSYDVIELCLLYLYTYDAIEVRLVCLHTTTATHLLPQEICILGFKTLNYDYVLYVVNKTIILNLISHSVKKRRNFRFCFYQHALLVLSFDHVEKNHNNYEYRLK